MAIDIKTPFDDDSHTFHDGALQRFFRMRKWMFAVGVTLTLLSTNWLDYAGVTKTFAVPTLPKEVTHTWVTFAGIYLLFQGAMVLRQIWVTYSESINLRVKGAIPVELVRIRSLSLDLLQKQAEVEPERQPTDHMMARTESQSVANAKYASLSSRLARLKAMEEEREPQANRVTAAVRVSEVCLDLLRIVPSYAFLLVATIHFGTIHWDIFFPPGAAATVNPPPPSR